MDEKENREDTLDQYVRVDFLMNRGESQVTEKVISYKRNSEGNPTGFSNENPILDTSIYVM